MIRFALAFFAALLLQGCVSLTPEQEKLYGRAIADERAELKVEKIDPTTAAVLSVFVPGLGHIYAGETALGVAWFPLGLIAPVAAPVAAWHDAREVNRLRTAEAYREHLESIADERRRHKVPDDDAITVWCDSCGAKVRADARWCPGCGRKRW